METGGWQCKLHSSCLLLMCLKLKYLIENRRLALRRLTPHELTKNLYRLIDDSWLINFIHHESCDIFLPERCLVFISISEFPSLYYSYVYFRRVIKLVSSRIRYTVFYTMILFFMDKIYSNTNTQYGIKCLLATTRCIVLTLHYKWLLRCLVLLWRQILIKLLNFMPRYMMNFFIF